VALHSWVGVTPAVQAGMDVIPASEQDFIVTFQEAIASIQGEDRGRGQTTEGGNCIIVPPTRAIAHDFLRLSKLPDKNHSNCHGIQW